MSVKVKALEWSEADYWPGVKSHEAKGAGFSYWIIARDDEFDVACRNDGWTISRLPSLDTAQAAVQADYEARILATLTPSTGTREDELREALTNARSMLITLAGDPRKFIAEDRGGMGDKTQAALLDQLDNALARITEWPKP